ncbi:MAG: L,D-transpeptidase [Phycisphaerae bacterium]|nr:L,D-transpeptidase [Phycisphaerae bacterium]
MPSDSPTSSPSRKGSFFHVLLGAEIVVLLALLGAWGYRAAARNFSETEQADSTPNIPAAAAPQTAPSHTLPATAPSRARKKPVQPPAASQAARWNAPLPELRSPMLLVEKSKQRLTVFDGRRIVKQYPASTGRNPGDKRREGDYRTPEGEFYVCVKNAKSKYTRALGLSYPSRDDARRGLRDGLITRQDYDRIVQAMDNKRQPPWNTPLGGEIMIHGDRRGGRTTQGCIALEDRDILELFPRIPLGTRVMIQP